MMLPDDVSRCQGALMEVTEDVSPHRLDMHPQCLHCLRRTDVLDGVVYPWIGAPLGLLAEPGALCEMRRT